MYNVKLSCYILVQYKYSVQTIYTDQIHAQIYASGIVTIG